MRLAWYEKIIISSLVIPEDGRTRFVTWDIPVRRKGSGGPTGFYRALNAIEATFGLKRIQYSVVMTRSRRAAWCMIKAAERYGGHVRVYLLEPDPDLDPDGGNSAAFRSWVERKSRVLLSMAMDAIAAGKIRDKDRLPDEVAEWMVRWGLVDSKEEGPEDEPEEE